MANVEAHLQDSHLKVVRAQENQVGQDPGQTQTWEAIWAMSCVINNISARKKGMILVEILYDILCQW